MAASALSARLRTWPSPLLTAGSTREAPFRFLDEPPFFPPFLEVDPPLKLSSAKRSSGNPSWQSIRTSLSLGLCLPGLSGSISPGKSASPASRHSRFQSKLSTESSGCALTHEANEAKAAAERLGCVPSWLSARLSTVRDLLPARPPPKVKGGAPQSASRPASPRWFPLRFSTLSLPPGKQSAAARAAQPSGPIWQWDRLRFLRKVLERSPRARLVSPAEPIGLKSSLKPSRLRFPPPRLSGLGPASESPRARQPRGPMRLCQSSRYTSFTSDPPSRRTSASAAAPSSPILLCQILRDRRALKGPPGSVGNALAMPGPVARMAVAMARHPPGPRRGSSGFTIRPSFISGDRKNCRVARFSFPPPSNSCLCSVRHLTIGPYTGRPAALLKFV
mmetsp:Transcript_3343/g.7724  ORF Transcript_3343/g.7724 Transcript_3343/m.7724 type:complete len:391 (-) Transcript_3343:278-1450(-)